MVCSVSFFISVMFIIAMVYCNMASYQNKTILNYRNQLPDNLKIIYDKITQERLVIYYQGYLLGLILSLFIILYNYKIKEEKLTLFSVICIVLATSFVVNYFYYTLYPKTNWMIDNINDVTQAKTWLVMYKHMKVYYHTGLLLGLISIIILAVAFRC
jgi:hypothetical protein